MTIQFEQLPQHLRAVEVVATADDTDGEAFEMLSRLMRRRGYHRLIVEIQETWIGALIVNEVSAPDAIEYVYRSCGKSDAPERNVL